MTAAVAADLVTAAKDDATAPAAGRRAYASLDGLRAVAALSVLVFHMQPLMQNEGKDIRGAELGQIGVNVFFVLSGYLIALSVLSAPTFDVRSYLVRRAARILPLYYAGLALVVLFVDATPLVTREGWVDLGLHLVLLHGLFPDYSFTINGVLWSLSAEWIFYLAMAAVAPWFRLRRGGWVVAGFAIVAGMAWRGGSAAWGGPDNVRFLTKTFPGWLDVFGLGMLVALATRTNTWAKLVSRRTVCAVLAVGAGAALLVTVAIYRQRLPDPPNGAYWRSDIMVTAWPTAFGVATALLIAALIACDDWIGPIVKRIGLAYLGVISYGIYILHPLLIQSLGRAWRATGRDGMAWSLAVAVVVTSIAAAAGAHRWIEVPALRNVPRWLALTNASGPRQRSNVPSTNATRADAVASEERSDQVPRRP